MKTSKPVVSADEKFVTISMSDYEQLLVDELTLNALYSFGVDNWEGYQEAMDSIEPEDF